MKTKGKSSALDKLIKAVQARECLWDKSYRGHRNRFKLERYWNEVAAEVGTTSLTCRKRWKNLKDQCRKEIKKNPHHSDWHHFEKLKFLHDQFLSQDEGDAEEMTLDETMHAPKLGYTIRKKFRVNKRRTIDLNTDKLIALVQAKEIIWNRQLKGHHNWYRLDQCWKEIAQELDVTRDEARLKWKYIRDQARKECRKEDSEWNLLPKLQFLVNQFNEQEGTENDSYRYFEETAEDSYYPDAAGEDNALSGTSIKGDEDFDEFDTKPVILETEFYDDDDEIRPGPSPGASEMKDEDVGFFDSLMPHVKKLPPAKKLMLRMKIQELVYNTVYNERQTV